MTTRRTHNQQGIQPDRMSEKFSLSFYLFKVTYLGESQKEAHAHKLVPILRSTHESGNRAPEKSKTRKEETGSDTSEDHVGGNFEAEVGDEEDEDDEGVLG
jgi:hypothetical protein